MTPEEAIREHLVDAAAVAALVGTRVYQLVLPQGATLPALRVQLIGTTDFMHLRGGSGVLGRSRIQVDAYAAEASGVDPYAQAQALADVVQDALDGQVFTVSASQESLKITGVFRRNRLPMYEPDELRQVRIVQDYIVWSRSLS